jgi:hypothetical protein
MEKIYEVDIDKIKGIKFYLVEKKDEFINTLWQTLEQAKAKIGTSYAVVMQQGEVISYGKTLGFITNKKEIN